MKHTHHIEHLDEGGTGPIPRIRRGVATLVHDVIGGTLEVGGEIAGGAIRVAGRGVRSFVRGLFHK